MAKFTVEDGKTGVVKQKGKKKQFEELFNFVLSVKKIVKGDVNGLICTCKPCTDPRHSL
jgi:hypothetical protein